MERRTDLMRLGTGEEANVEEENMTDNGDHARHGTYWWVLRVGAFGRGTVETCWLRRGLSNVLAQS